ITLRPSLFVQAFGDPSSRFSVTRAALFAQDRWQARANLTIDAGLRYEIERLPDLFHQNYKNFSPRIGVAYSPGSKGRSVVRGTFGLLYDRQVLAFLNQAIVKDGTRAFELRFVDQNAMPAPSIYRAEPELHTPYSLQASLGLEQAFSGDIVVSANYLFVRGIHLSRTRNINLLPPVLLTPANAQSLGISDPTPQQLGRPVFSPL